MKLLLIILSLTILIIIYSIYAYIDFFAKIGLKSLKNPNPRVVFEFNKKNNIQKPYKYISLGDSLTAGIGNTNYKSTYPYLLAEKLSQVDQNQYLQLINLGIPGAKSLDIINTSLVRAVEEQPDLTTILIGINDMHNHTPSLVFKKNLEELITTLSSQTKTKIILINIPYLGSGHVRNTPVQYYFDIKTRELNKIVKDLSEEKNIQYIDLYTPSKLKSESDKSFYAEDDFHPSEKGYLYWSSIINANINP